MVIRRGFGASPIVFVLQVEQRSTEGVIGVLKIR